MNSLHLSERNFFKQFFSAWSKKSGEKAIALFDAVVLGHPKSTLVALIFGFAFLGYWIKDFRLDASSDSLVLEHDQDLRYYRKLNQRYRQGEFSGDFVFIAYTPQKQLFSKETLDQIKSLREELKKLERVSSVITLLDVPLLKNPPGPLKDLKKNLKTLEEPKAKLSDAVQEFKTSPIYQELLVSPDLKSTALIVNFRQERNQELFDRREALRELKLDGKLTPETKKELKQVEIEVSQFKDRVRQMRHEDLKAIRKIVDQYKREAKIVLGGVPMIVDDMISFIKSDLKVFSTALVLLLILLLYIEFRRLRWVVLPLLTCFFSIFTMMGLLGFFRFDVTVVSSNFISLQLILTLQLAVYLVGRYNELVALHPNASNRQLVREAVRGVFVPIVYSQLTNIAGFSSLITCDILPVVNFGWMMSYGLVVSLANIFLILPIGMLLLPKPPLALPGSEFVHPLTSFCARFVERHRGVVLSIAALFAIATAIGATRLKVENSFIDYFKKTTEIYRGMKFIDENLGGTTPLDVIVEFKQEESADSGAQEHSSDKEFALFSEFEEKEKDPSKYWFTADKLELIEKIHNYLEGLPETGKVMSLATLYKTARELNENKEMDNLSTSLLYTATSEKFKNILVHPFVAVTDNQARFIVRIKDSMKELRRDALLKKIRSDLSSMLDQEKNAFQISGIMVLYNNMLQSLYDSQIKTIAWTLLPLWIMFFLLWRSVRTALVALVPSLIACSSVLGFMGWVEIPLDMMTITVVAVALGIAVNNAVLYMYRFRYELAVDGDYAASMHRCHSTIGNSMVNGSIPIILGFSVLMLSNFIPTVLFGLLVAVAMIIALASDLNLLPSIILTFKPFGKLSTK